MGEIRIPVEVFSDRDLCVLEGLVEFLREERQLSFAAISRLLNRDSRTIWTSYNRAKKKREVKS